LYATIHWPAAASHVASSRNVPWPCDATTIGAASRTTPPCATRTPWTSDGHGPALSTHAMKKSVPSVATRGDTGLSPRWSGGTSGTMENTGPIGRRFVPKRWAARRVLLSTQVMRYSSPANATSAKTG
jgi:hypothetical protein